MTNLLLLINEAHYTGRVYTQENIISVEIKNYILLFSVMSSVLQADVPFSYLQ